MAVSLITIARLPISIIVRSLVASDIVQTLDFIREEPWTPLASVFLANDGPDTALIGINSAAALMQLKINETRTIEDPKEAKQISRLWYQCAPGETATVRLEGIY